MRAIGPDLSKLGVKQALKDPVLQVCTSKGEIVAVNNDWQTGQPAEIIQQQLAPRDTRDSAIFATLNPGKYALVVRGVAGVAQIQLQQVP